MDAARTEKWKKNRLASFTNICLAQVILPFHPTSMTLLSKTVKINFQEPKRTNKYLKETKMWHLKLIRSLDKDDQLMSFCCLSTAVHAAGWIIHINLKSAKKKVLNSIGIRCPEDIFGWFFIIFMIFNMYFLFVMQHSGTDWGCLCLSPYSLCQWEIQSSFSSLQASRKDEINRTVNDMNADTFYLKNKETGKKPPKQTNNPRMKTKQKNQDSEILHKKVNHSK